jgi:hypothetical protein
VVTEERITVNGGSGGTTYQSKTYQCHLELYFGDKTLEPLVSNGLGKSKKEARKVGVRHLVTLLIQNGLIRLGLKDKSFLKVKRPTLEEKARELIKESTQETKVDASLEERNKRLKKEIKRISKRMQESLKEENLIDACHHFCQIICNKVPDWNEVAQIWGYAIAQKKIKFVRIILDLIQYKRVNNDMADDLGDDSLPVDDKDASSSDKKAEMYHKVNTIYGFHRVRCQNPYDIIVMEDHPGQAEL